MNSIYLAPYWYCFWRNTLYEGLWNEKVVTETIVKCYCASQYFCWFSPINLLRRLYMYYVYNGNTIWLSYSLCLFCRIAMCSGWHWLQAFLHMIQVFISYCLMLIFMTFNAWLCIAVCVGAGIGYLLFGWMRSRMTSSSNEHCNWW